MQKDISTHIYTFTHIPPHAQILTQINTLYTHGCTHTHTHTYMYTLPDAFTFTGIHSVLSQEAV